MLKLRIEASASPSSLPSFSSPPQSFHHLVAFGMCQRRDAGDDEGSEIPPAHSSFSKLCMRMRSRRECEYIKLSNYLLCLAG